MRLNETEIQKTRENLSLIDEWIKNNISKYLREDVEVVIRDNNGSDYTFTAFQTPLRTINQDGIEYVNYAAIDWVGIRTLQLENAIGSRDGCLIIQNWNNIKQQLLNKVEDVKRMTKIINNFIL